MDSQAAAPQHMKGVIIKDCEMDSQAAAPQGVIIKDSEMDSQAPQHKTEVIIKDSEIDSQAAAPQHKTEVIIKDSEMEPQVTDTQSMACCLVSSFRFPHAVLVLFVLLHSINYYLQLVLEWLVDRYIQWLFLWCAAPGKKEGQTDSQWLTLKLS